VSDRASGEAYNTRVMSNHATATFVLYNITFFQHRRLRKTDYIETARVKLKVKYAHGMNS